MAVATASSLETLADLIAYLGHIDLQRIRLHPAPGTATEQDVVTIHQREKRLCELLEGVLVEKAMGFQEACLAIALGSMLRAFVRPRNLGLISGADGMMRLASGLVRIPDLAFISWERLPNRRMPTVPIPALAPDLAIEVLSAGNTPGEMARKRHDYFTAGVRLVWIVDPVARTVSVYTSPDDVTVLAATAILNGGEVLPGFTLPIQDLFAELDLQGS